MLNKRLLKLLKKWNKEHGDNSFRVSCLNDSRADIQQLFHEGYIEKKMFWAPDIEYQGDNWSLEVFLTSNGKNYKAKHKEELFDKWFSRLVQILPWTK